MIAVFSFSRTFPMHFDEKSMFAGNKIEAKTLKVNHGGSSCHSVT